MYIHKNKVENTLQSYRRSNFTGFFPLCLSESAQLVILERALDKVSSYIIQNRESRPSFKILRYYHIDGANKISFALFISRCQPQVTGSLPALMFTLFRPRCFSLPFYVFHQTCIISSEKLMKRLILCILYKIAAI